MIHTPTTKPQWLSILFVFAAIVGLHADASAQQGTFNWQQSCPNNGCPGSFTDANGVNIRVTETDARGGAPETPSTTLVGTTIGNSGVVTTPANANTSVLNFTVDYLTYIASSSTAAVNGNEIDIDFDRLLSGVSIPIYDISSITLACNSPARATAVYNDEVEVWGIDGDDNLIAATIQQTSTTAVISGNFFVTNDYVNLQDEQWTVRGNTAFSQAGYLCNRTNIPCFSQLAGTPQNEIGQDIVASFNVPVRGIHIVIRNNPLRLGALMPPPPGVTGFQEAAAAQRHRQCSSADCLIRTSTYYRRYAVTVLMIILMAR